MSTTHEKQFTYQIQENGKTIAGSFIDDPFITSIIRPRGLRNAIAVLLGRYKLCVQVEGTREAMRVIFQGDYTKNPDLWQSQTLGIAAETSSSFDWAALRRLRKASQ